MTARAEGAPAPDGQHIRAAKDALRRRLVAARLALPAELRAARATALAAAAVRLAAGVTGPVCAYVPVGTEPGSVGLVEALHTAGHEVLLPVVVAAAPLDWARFDGAQALADARFGLREPAGARLGASAIGRAGLVLVPGLAADRRGARLGRGGGYYDRTLHLAPDGAPLVVVLNDEELLDEVPAEPHDRPVTAALLAEAGITRLGNRS